MVLKIHKILFIFLLIALLASCATDDEDMDIPQSNNEMASGGKPVSRVNGIVVSQPWWVFSPDIAVDSIPETDTLAEFPSQSKFSTRGANYVFGLQRLAYDIVLSLLDLPSSYDNNWMSFNTSNLGTFVSLDDSRPKQWQLDCSVEFDGKTWPYHLVVTDLPDANPDGRNNKAVDFYYDDNFGSGVLFFAPSHLNPVMYPEKMMGRGLRCCLHFSNNDGVLENTLLVSNFADNGSVSAHGNIYLYSKRYSNSILLASIVDMPHLWFGKKEDIGYSVMLMGGIDCNGGNLAMVSALCPNTVTQNLSESLIKEFGVESSMKGYNGLWNTVSGQDTLYEYQSPAFLNGGNYIGAGREVEDRTAYSKALSVMEEAKKFEYQVSPYKVSIQQIEEVEW